MSTKTFKLKPWEIAPVTTGRGFCLSTDRIVVDGKLVGYMYRQPPIEELDSGWRFFAGDEDEGYMANNDLHGVYEVNTIVNYDPDVLPFLDAAIGARFERAGETFRQLRRDE